MLYKNETRQCINHLQNKNKEGISKKLLNYVIDHWLFWEGVDKWQAIYNNEHLPYDKRPKVTLVTLKHLTSLGRKANRDVK